MAIIKSEKSAPSISIIHDLIVSSAVHWSLIFSCSQLVRTQHSDTSTHGLKNNTRLTILDYFINFQKNSEMCRVGCVF